VADLLFQRAGGEWIFGHIDREDGASPNSFVVEQVESLAGDEWGSVTRASAKERLRAGEDDLTIADLAATGYLEAGGSHLLEIAAEYASARIQFGQPIGERQAISHPIADCYTQLAAARSLAEVCAAMIETLDPRAPWCVVAARRSAAKAALTAVQVAHQTLGAMGFASESPLGLLPQRVSQLALAPTMCSGNPSQATEFWCGESSRDREFPDSWGLM
jgi:hypothetical protein